jgi:hypothetical protein
VLPNQTCRSVQSATSSSPRATTRDILDAAVPPHKHVAQSLYVQSAAAQSPRRGITYGPLSAAWTRKSKWLPWVIVALLSVATVIGVLLVF